MRNLILAAVVAASASAGTANAQDYFYSERYVPTGPNGYVYDMSWGRTRAPSYGYYDYGYNPGTVYGGYYDGYRPLPPYGFGDPSYNGYNDPYFSTYGPAMQDFLRFGGADFYGF